MRKRFVERYRKGSSLILWGAVTVLVFSGFAMTARTVEAAESASAPVEADEGVPCPYVTEARYPFLQCEQDAWGSIVLDAPVQEITGLRIPKMDSFIEGPGYWGS